MIPKVLVHWIELNAWFGNGVWVGWSKATLIKYHTTLDSINSLDLYIIITEHFISSSQFSLPIKMSHLSTIQLTQMLFLQKTIAQELNEPCTSLWLRCVPRTSNGVGYGKKITLRILQMRKSTAKILKQTYLYVFFLFFLHYFILTFLIRKKIKERELQKYIFLSDSYGIRLVPIVSKMRKIKSLAISIIIFS